MTDSHSSEKHAWVRRLVDEHQAPLIRYARSIAGDEHLARDVVQDAFLKLCLQSPEDLTGHEAAWLFRVCHNLALNRQRKDRRMSSSSETVDAAAADADPSQNLSAAEDEQQLSKWIDELPENQQQVIRLKFHSGLKYREISDATGLSESNVGFLLHTALRTLRRQLQISGTPSS